MNSKFTLVFLLLLSTFSSLIAQQSEKINLKDGAIDHEFEMPTSDLTFEVCGLEKGEEYYMMMMDDRGNKQCSYDLSPSKVTILENKIDAFIAKGSCMQLDITRFECRADVQYFYPRLKVFKVNQPDEKMTPMLLNENSDVEYLVKEVLLGNTCGDVFNITSVGQIGTFSAGSNSIGIEDGIVMSCAPIGQMQGGNTGTGQGGAIGGYPGNGDDYDLSLLTNRNMREAAIIEFDFIPVDDNLSFKYVFASDEYCDYAGIDVLYNDAFGFFLSGPGIDGPYTNGTNIVPGGENIATVPGTDDPVTIDNIHWYGAYPEYYVTNIHPTEPGNGNCSPEEYAQGGCCLTETPFDGFTTVLTAQADLIPCETYHIRIVIADAVDQIFGSAVFIEGGSFSIGDGLDYEVVFNQTGSNYLYEGCGDSTGVIQFIRTDQGTAAGEQFINMGVGTTGTATKNKDYQISFNQTISIPPLPAPGLWFEEISVLNDTIVEQNEWVQLDLEVPCECDQQSLGFTIVDVLPLQLSNIIDVDYCFSQPVLVSPTLEGGLPDAAFNGDVFEYTYFWTGPNGYFSDELQLNHMPPEGAGFYQYFFTAFDDCGTTVNDTVNVTITGTPAASIAGDGFVCPESPETALEVLLDGPGPWDLVYAIDGVEQTMLNINSSPYMLPATAEGDYELVSVTSFGCEGDVQGVAQVTSPVFSLTTDPVNPSCFGTSTGTINVNAAGGATPYTYAWSDGQTTQQAINVNAGSYTVVITDDNGCTTSIADALTDPVEVTATASLLAGTTCAQPSSGQAMVSPLGGTGVYTYQWSSGATTETANGLSSGMALVTVTDENGCATEQSVDIPADVNTPQSVSNVNDILTCADLEIDLNANGSSTGADFTYQWTGSGIVSGADSMTPTVNSPGSYQLLVTDASNGCTETSSVMVTNDLENPTPQATTSDILTCTQLNTTLDGSGSTGNAGLSYEWFNSAGTSVGTGISVQVADVDIYTLEVMNTNNGCIETQSINVTEDVDYPNADAGNLATLTCSVLTLDLNGNGSDSGTNFTYQWTAQNGSSIDNATMLTPTISNPDVYQILVTNTDNGCSEVAEVTIDEDVLLPDALASTADILTCTDTEAEISGAGSSTGTSFTYSWTNSGGTEVATSLSAMVDSPDTYTLEVTNTDNGCIETATVEIETDENTPVSVAGLPQVITCDEAMVTLDGSNSTSSATITYVWTDSNGTEIGDTPIIETNAADVYTLTVLDSSNGCEIASSVTVDENTNDPVALTSAPQILNCLDTEFIIDGGTSTGQSANLTYEWSASDGSTIANTATTPVTAPDTYTLLITDLDNGCTNENTLTIDQNIDQPIADAGDPSTITCDEVSVPLNAMASTGDNLVYEWTNELNETVSTDAQTMTELEGTFAVLVTNTVNGCTDIAEVIIDIDVDRPTVDAGETVNLTCATLDAMLDASNSTGGANLSYEWAASDGSMIASEALTNVTAPDTYTVTVTNDDNNCKETGEVTITQNIEIPLADAGAEQILSCSDEDVQLLGTASSVSGNLVYEWTSSTGNIIAGATTLNPTVDQPAMYDLLVTNTDNECTETASVEVLNDDNAPTAETATPDVLDCVTPTLFLDGTPSSQNGDFSYSWSTMDGSIINAASTLNPLVNEPGTYTLTVLDNANGCETSTSLTVEEDVELPNADAGDNLLLNCNNTTLLADASNSSAGEDFTYLWTTNDGTFTGDETENAVTVTNQGTYNLLVTNTMNGCTNETDIQVTEDFAAPVLAFEDPAVLNCLITSIEVSSSITNGQNFDYVWTTSNGSIVGDNTTGSITVDQPGDYDLAVTNIDNGCLNNSFATVIQDVDNPDVDAGNGSELTCSVTEAALNGSGSEGASFVYNWTTPNGNIITSSDALAATANEAGIYSLMVTNSSNGCTSEDDVEITLNENVPTDILANVTPPPCFGDPGTISVETIEGGVGPYVYSLDGVNYTPDPIFTGLQDGANYNVFILDANGCDLEETLFIDAIPPVTVDLTPNVQIEIGDEQELNTLTNIPLNEVASVTWTPSTYLVCDTCLVTTSQATQTTLYTVNVVNIFGCEDSAQIIVEVDRDINIYTPNAFSPFSSGGTNDKFTIFSKEGTIESIKTMRVYDRWGNQVYEAFDFPANDAINYGWDGRFKDKDMDVGVYIFWAEVELITGQIELLKGDLTLMK